MFCRTCAVFVAVYYIVTVCGECDLTCKKCKDPTCNKCHSGYFFNSTGICQICPENCFSCLNETHCTTCKRGVGLFLHANGECKPCAENCVRCADETKCEVCGIKYMLESGKCKKCPENCNECNEHICSLCDKGFYLINSTCQSCNSMCLSCSSIDNCTECISGSWGPICNDTCLYVNRMSRCYDGKCDQETGECTKCEVGTFGVYCENICPDNCQHGLCDINGRCSQGCQQGFYGDACRKLCPRYCQGKVCDLKGLCTYGCKAGYYNIFCDVPCLESETSCVNTECFQANGTCIQECPHNCRSCTSKSQCNVCKHGFYGIICEQKCTDCIGNLCKLRECKYGCREGLYKDGEACKPCRTNCSKCTSFDQCVECFDGWYGQTCQLKCDKTSCSACEINSGNCAKCMTGSNLRDSTCCPENCLSCTEDGRCFDCVDGFFGNTCNCSCMENCNTCLSPDNCTECGLYRYDSKLDLEAGLCLCDEQECKAYANVEACRQCKRFGWYTHKRGCCPCPEHCKSECKQLTGHCKDGCQKGWFGPHCDNRCAIRHCVICRNHDTCQQCENEYFGQICQFNCSLGCLQISVGPLCDMENGHCFHGCKNGTWGKTCNRTCSNNCVSGFCDSSNGYCLECHSAHYGLYCEKEAESKFISSKNMIHIIAFCIALCTVFCIVVVSVVIVMRKRCRRSDRDSDMDKNSVRIDEIGTTVTGTRGRRKPKPDDEVITENAMYVPFQPRHIGHETKTQNTLVVEPKGSNYENLALNDPEANTQNASEAKPRSSGEVAGLIASNYENIPPNNPDAVHVRQLRTATGLETGNKVSLGHGSGIGEFE